MATFPVAVNEDYEYLYVTGPKMSEPEKLDAGDLQFTGIKIKELCDEIRNLKEMVHEYEETCKYYGEKIKDYEAEKMRVIKERRKDKDTLMKETRKWKDIAFGKEKEIQKLQSKIRVLAEKEKELREQIKVSENTPNNEEFERQKREVAESKIEIEKLKQQITDLEKTVATKDDRISKNAEEKIEKMSSEIATIKRGQDEIISKLIEKDNTHKGMLDMIKEKDKANREMTNMMKEKDKANERMFDVMKNFKENFTSNRRIIEEQNPNLGRRSLQISNRNTAVQVETINERRNSFIRSSEHAINRSFENKTEHTDTTEQHGPNMARRSGYFPDVKETRQCARYTPNTAWKSFFQSQGKR